MRRLKMKFYLVGLMLLLSSCAYVQKQSCARIDWNKEGINSLTHLFNGVPAHENWKRKLEYFKNKCGRFEDVYNETAFMDAVRKEGFSRCTNQWTFDSRSWEGIAKRDVWAGKKTQLEDYQSSCQKFDVTVDEASYSKSYTTSLREFCTIEGGLKLGSSGGSYLGTCPKSSEALFLKGYQTGTLVHRAKTDEQVYQETLQEIETSKNDIARNNRIIASNTKDLLSLPSKFSGRKQEALGELSELNSELADLDPSLEDYNEQRSDLHLQVSAANEELAQIEFESNELHKKLTKEIAKAHRDIPILEQRIVDLSGSVPSLKLKVKKSDQVAKKAMKSLRR